METMWAPWRSEYISGTADSEKPKPDVCVFCDALKTKDDHERFIIYRGEVSFVILNKFPDNNGHVLVMPNRHISRPDMMTEQERFEIMNLIVKAQTRSLFHRHAISRNRRPDCRSATLSNTRNSKRRSIPSILHETAFNRLQRRVSCL